MTIHSNVQDTCVHSIIKMSWVEVSLYWFCQYLHLLQKSLLVVVGGGTVKIASAPGPDHLISNWNRLE